MTIDEYEELWRAVTAEEIDDPTRWGLFGDWCPFCGADWKEQHREGCESPYASDPDAERARRQLTGEEPVTDPTPPEQP